MSVGADVRALAAGETALEARHLEALRKPRLNLDGFGLLLIWPVTIFVIVVVAQCSAAHCGPIRRDADRVAARPRGLRPRSDARDCAAAHDPGSRLEVIKLQSSKFKLLFFLAMRRPASVRRIRGPRRSTKIVVSDVS